MQSRDYDTLKSRGVLAALREKGLVRRRAWSQVRQRAFDFDLDLLKEADSECKACNGTGVIRQVKIAGERFTIVCDCLPVGERGGV